MFQNHVQQAGKQLRLPKQVVALGPHENDGKGDIYKRSLSRDVGRGTHIRFSVDKNTLKRKLDF